MNPPWWQRWRTRRREKYIIETEHDLRQEVRDRIRRELARLAELEIEVDLRKRDHGHV